MTADQFLADPRLRELAAWFLVGVAFVVFTAHAFAPRRRPRS